jgi:hypothetical protein
VLDPKRREFIALVGGGGLLLAAKVKRARGQQPAMPVVGLLGATTASEQFRSAPKTVETSIGKLQMRQID